MFVRLADGAIRNAYTVRIAQQARWRRARVHAQPSTGSPASIVEVVGDTRDDGRFVIEVGPDQTREVRVLVTDYADSAACLDAAHVPPLRRR